MNANHAFTNELIHETSPYLLQHAHNPVNWIPWSDSLFEFATEQNKPILLSIGYAACHWCHVMERESFESEEVAAYMNAHFINVKVDREERPDVDHLYMDALQAMTGSGGWPLNIFLLPNGKPFYGGTYFPPIAMQNRASWMDVLKGVQNAFENNNDKLVEQATHLANHLVQANIKSLEVENTNDNHFVADKEDFDIMANRILLSADTTWGGFGAAPKFPQTFSLQLLLRHYHVFKNEASLYQVKLSLDKMIQGGIYDHIGGGFSRYSTDAQWQAPHFEKMLYDNALLVGVLAETYQLTQKEDYKIVIYQTIQFLERELSNGEGAFYAALDADSEGVEGKFYTWSYDALKNIVPAESFEKFVNYYQIKKQGNWEHTNILWTQSNFLESEKNEFKTIKETLFKIREKRIRPALDHKVILSWNALMITGLCKASAALGDSSLRDKAMKGMQWIENNMFNASENYFYHTSTNGINKSFAFLDDYASLIQAYIHLQEMTGDLSYAYKAKQWTEYVQLHFLDEENVFYYFTADYQKDVIIRKKDNYDGAQPSANAIMSFNLLYLANMFDQAVWKEQTIKMVSSMHKRIIQYPSSFGCWAQTFALMAFGFTELVSVGADAQKAILELQGPYLPFKMLLIPNQYDASISLLNGKQLFENQYFICKHETCSSPYPNLNDFLTTIKQTNY
ncbi:MAG: hypothetical protein RLZ95_1708 [Bacteroidota bacterium]|jgi:uncharacterized protein YyaL (SSP411 family)